MDYYKNIDRLDYVYKPLTAKGVEYTVIEDLVTEPISLEEVKQHLRVDYNIDDNLIRLYITAARQYLESYTQKSFGVKTIGLTALSLPDHYKLMHGVVDEIIEGDYELFGGRLKKGGENIELKFTTIGVMNDNIKNAIAMEAASRYMMRESIPINDNGNSPGQLMNLAKQLVDPYREIIL